MLAAGCWLLAAGCWLMAVVCLAGPEVVLIEGCMIKPHDLWGWSGGILVGVWRRPWEHLGSAWRFLGSARVSPGGPLQCLETLEVSGHAGGCLGVLGRFLEGPWWFLGGPSGVPEGSPNRLVMYTGGFEHVFEGSWGPVSLPQMGVQAGGEGQGRCKVGWGFP